MMSIEELHEHYKSVRARLNDPEKIAAVKKTEEAVKNDAVVEAFEPKFPSPSSEIIYRVAQKHGVGVGDIRGPSRKPILVLARQEAAYEIRMKRGLSLPQIGVMLGRDHTTVLHGIKRHTALLAKKAQEEQ